VVWPNALVTAINPANPTVTAHEALADRHTAGPRPHKNE